MSSLRAFLSSFFFLSHDGMYSWEDTVLAFLWEVQYYSHCTIMAFRLWQAKSFVCGPRARKQNIGRFMYVCMYVCLSVNSYHVYYYIYHCPFSSLSVGRCMCILGGLCVCVYLGYFFVIFCTAPTELNHWNHT